MNSQRSLSAAYVSNLLSSAPGDDVIKLLSSAAYRSAYLRYLQHNLE